MLINEPSLHCRSIFLLSLTQVLLLSVENKIVMVNHPIEVQILHERQYLRGH